MLVNKLIKQIEITCCYVLTFKVLTTYMNSYCSKKLKKLKAILKYF